MEENDFMNKALEFLKACGTFYLATVEDDQPRVRLWGALAEINGKFYTSTSNVKPVFKQITANPKIELCGFTDGKWIRISATAVVDPARETKVAMLEVNPGLSRMYNADDGIFEVFYFADATATITSFGAEPEIFNF